MKSENQPPFWGYFPAVVDGTLLSLVTTSYPDDPERQALSEGALAERRFLALDSLEKSKTHLGHDYAVRILKKALADGRPFGLYLRNFALGARATEGGVDPHGIPQVRTVSSFEDLKMQLFVAENSTAQFPFVAIANRAYDGGPLSRLVVSDDDWQAAAEVLVTHAGVIVMYFLTGSAGVEIELELIRRAGAQGRTLLVVAEDDPRGGWLDELTAAVAKASPPASPATRTPPPDDFPNQIQYEDSEPGQEAIKSALQTLIRAAAPPSVSVLPNLPPADVPTPQALSQAGNRAVAEFDAASAHVERGEGVQAEDALIRSIAFSHWARDPLGRAVAFAMLAGVEQHLLKYPNEAVSSYFMSIDIFESLLETSETARESFARVVEGLATYLEELGDEKRAKQVRDRYRLQNT